jgi:hypothetical protein
LGYLSFKGNQLIALPDSIIRLHPTQFFDVGYNRLCSLSVSVTAWANQYDPDWATTQDSCGPQAIESAATRPATFSLLPPKPNPFNPSTQLAYTLPTPSQVKIEVYSLSGSRIAVLDDRIMEVGRHSTTWNAKNAGSGIYYFRITAGNYKAVRRGLLVK